MGRAILLVATAGFLFISVSLKVRFEPTFGYREIKLQAYDRIAPALSSLGYETISEDGTPITLGYRGGCLLKIDIIRPEGGDEGIFREKYGIDSDISYIFESKVFKFPPFYLSITKRILKRFEAVFGPVPSPDPIFQVAHSRECAPSEISTLAGQLGSPQ